MEGKEINIEDTKVDFLKPQDVQETAALLTKSFIKMNKLWSRSGCTYEQLYSMFRGKMICCQQSGGSFLMKYKGKIVAATVSVDLVDYLSWHTMPNQVEVVKIIAQYSHELEYQYFKSLNAKRGQIQFGYMSAVDQSMANAGITLRFWVEGWCLLRAGRWKYNYTRISNPIAGKLMQKFGAKIVKELVLDHPLVKGQKFQLMKTDVQNLDLKSMNSFFKPRTDSLLC